MTRMKAHAGCGGTGPNTAASILCAVNPGASIVEIDVQVTGDRVPVAWHDDVLGGLVLRESGLAALKREEPKLLTLDEALALTKDFSGLVNLDLKTQDYVVIREAAARYGLLEKTVLTGVDAAALPCCRAALPQAAVWHSAPYRPEGIPDEAYEDYARFCCQEAAEADSRDLNIWYGNCRSSLVALAHSRGIRVHVWTVNSREEMENASAMGVDSITTDCVALLRQVLEEQKEGN